MMKHIQIFCTQTETIAFFRCEVVGKIANSFLFIARALRNPHSFFSSTFSSNFVYFGFFNLSEFDYEVKRKKKIYLYNARE